MVKQINSGEPAPAEEPETIELLKEDVIYKYVGGIAAFCLTAFALKQFITDPGATLQALISYWRPPVWAILAILWTTGVGLTVRTGIAVFGLAKSGKVSCSFRLFLNAGLALALFASALVFTGIGIKDFENELCRLGPDSKARLLPFVPVSVERTYLKVFEPICLRE